MESKEYMNSIEQFIVKHRASFIMLLCYGVSLSFYIKTKGEYLILTKGSKNLLVASYILDNLYILIGLYLIAKIIGFPKK